jgi:AraC-like DNA-binding protein
MHDPTNLNLSHPVPACSWQVKPIRHVEDLHDAVLGAGLTPTVMSRKSVTGSLAFSTWNGMLFSSGLLNGKVWLDGTLSENLLTFGTGLILEGRCQHWLHDIEVGTVGVFGPGADHDAIYSGRSLYIGVTLPEDRLLLEAEQRGVIIDPSALRTGLTNRPVSADPLRRLRNDMLAVHKRTARTGSGRCEETVLNSFLDYFGRPPRVSVGLSPLRGHERIVGHARDWIFGHLDQPIQIDQIAAGAMTSRRTLHRAFLEVLEETPQAYVRRLRLHRIREELATDSEAACTIAVAANQWGMGALGRVSARYRALFGELPSETIQRVHRSTPSDSAQTG